MEWAVDHFGLSLTEIDPLLAKISGQKRFLHFDLSFARLVTLDLWRYVFTELEVFAAFLFG